MFSLIITIISVALVAALALATLFYGGSAYEQAQANAQAAKIRSQGQQLLGAADLYFANTGQWPQTMQQLLDGDYLKSVPTAQASLKEALANADKEWDLVTPSVPVFLLETELPEACREVNEESFGDRGIAPTIDPSQLVQCFGTSLSSLVTVVSKDPGYLVEAMTSPSAAAEVGGTSLQARPAANANTGWLVPPQSSPVGKPAAGAGTEGGEGSGEGEPPVDPEPVGGLTGASVLNFGEVDVGSSAQRELVLTNTSSSPITSLGAAQLVLGEGDFSIVGNDCGSSLAPGADCRVTIAFAPQSAGPVSGSVVVTSGSPDSPLTSVLSGLGATAAGSLSGNGAFGSLAANTVNTRDFTFFNVGTKTLTGLKAELLTSNEQLTLSSNSCGSAASPRTLAQGESCSMTVRWAPTAASAINGSSLKVTGPFQGGFAEAALTGQVGTFDANAIWSTPSLTNYGTRIRGTSSNTDIKFSVGADFRLLNNGTSGPLAAEFVMTGDVEHFRFFGAMKTVRNGAIWESAQATSCATGLTDTTFRCTADDPALGASAKRDIRPLVQFKPTAVGDFSVTISARTLNGAPVPGTSITLTGRGEWNPTGVWTQSVGSSTASANPRALGATSLGGEQTFTVAMRNEGTYGVMRSAFLITGDTDQFTLVSMVRSNNLGDTRTCGVGGAVPGATTIMCETDERSVGSANFNRHHIVLNFRYNPTEASDHQLVITPVQGTGDSVLPGPLTVTASGAFNATGQWRNGPRTGSNSTVITQTNFPLTAVGSTATLGGSNGLLAPYFIYLHNVETSGAMQANVRLTGDTEHFTINAVQKVDEQATPNTTSCGATRVSPVEFTNCLADVKGSGGSGNYRNIRVQVYYTPKAPGNHSVSLEAASNNGSQMPAPLVINGEAVAGFTAVSGTGVSVASNNSAILNWASGHAPGGGVVGSLRSSGKYLPEFRTFTTRNLQIGLTGSAGSVYFDLSNNTIVTDMANARVGANPANGVAFTNTFSTADAYNLAVDLDSRTVTLYKNNGGLVASVTNIDLGSGVQPAVYKTTVPNWNSNTVTVNNGQVGAAMNLPAGYTRGWR